MDKIVRSICFFSSETSGISLNLFEHVSTLLERKGYSIQTKRVCFLDANGIDESILHESDFLMGIGALSNQQAKEFLPLFLHLEKTSFVLDLTSEKISESHVDLLYEIISKRARHTFNFTYGFNTSPSSPYFPSATFDREGFSIGLQPTNLAAGCTSVSEWLEKMEKVWDELHTFLSPFPEFLGIDSSIAPLHLGEGSLIHFIKKTCGSFSSSVTTDIYTKISGFIQNKNPRPIGLCGIMFPCLEDFELAQEYERGNFSIERNLFLSLHSGLGIDTYPIGIDQPKERVVEILRLVQALSRKYKKSLSVRFVSDGKAKIGERARFNNPYLYDVRIREL